MMLLLLLELLNSCHLTSNRRDRAVRRPLTKSRTALDTLVQLENRVASIIER
jgi:hypothetical protein